MWRQFIIIMVLSCMALMTSTVKADNIRSDWYQHYQPLQHKEAHIFLDKGVSYVIELFGQPRQHVSKIYLRLSYPIHREARLRSGFQLFEITDSQKGLYTIYLSRHPSEYAFWGQLAHEIPHIVNPKLHDAYAEGLNTLFAEKLLKREGLEWDGWVNHFRNGGDPLYGLTYFMLKEIERAAGEKNISRLMEYVEYSDESARHMHINIRQWLDSLPLDIKKSVSGIIKSYAPEVCSRIKNIDLAFMLPE